MADGVVIVEEAADTMIAAVLVSVEG